MKFLKNAFLRIVLIFLSISLFIFISEMILKILPEKYQRLSKIYFMIADEQASKCMELDKQVLYRFVKNRLQAKDCPPTDQYGFRLTQSQEVTGSPNIVFLGDSFTYGHGVNNNETYPWHVSHFFQDTKINVNIYNTGIPGYGMDQEILQLETNILQKIKPDIVLWNIHENDLYDNNQACLFAFKNRSLIHHSATLNTMYILSTIHAHIPKFIKSTKLYWFVLSVFPQRWTYGCSIAENSNNFEAYQLEKMDALMGYMNKLKETHRFKLVVVFIQGQYGYEGEAKQPSWYNTRINKILEVIKKSTPDAIIVSDIVKNNNRIAQSSNSPVLGATTNFPRNLFLTVDGAFAFESKHMSPTGNLEVAKAVFSELKKSFSQLQKPQTP